MSTGVRRQGAEEWGLGVGLEGVERSGIHKRFVLRRG